MTQNETILNSDQVADGKNKICFKFMQLSHTLENIELKNKALIAILMLSKSFLAILLPSLLMLVSLKIRVGNFQTLCTDFFLYRFDIQSLSSNLSKYLLIQILILAVLLILLIVLFYLSSQLIQQYAVRVLTVFYFYSGIFMLAQINFYYNLQGDSRDEQYARAISLVNIGIGICLIVLYKFLAHTYSPFPANPLCSRFEILQLIGDFIANGIAVEVFFQAAKRKYQSWSGQPGNSETAFIVSLFILLFITLYKLKNEFQCFTYIVPFVSKIYRTCLTFEFSCIGVTLWSLIIKQDLLVQNYFYAVICFYFFLYVTLEGFLKNRSESYRLKSYDEIKTSDDAILFIQELNKFFQIKYFKNANESDLYMLKNLHTRHKESCLEPACFCHQITFNKKYIVEMIPLYRRLTLRIMEQFCERNIGQRSQITKFVLWIKLIIHQNFMGVSILTKSERINQLQKQLTSGMFLHKYNLQIKRLFQVKQSLLNFANTQQILQADGLAEKIINKIYEVVDSKTIFWGYLKKGIMNEQVEMKIEKQFSLLKDVNNYTQVVISKFCSNCFLINLVITYQWNILLKERTSRELLLCLTRLEAINQNTARLYDRGSQSELIEKIMYSNSTCTIEISLDSQQVGAIVSVSSNTKNIFGFQQKSLIGSNINKIMPKKMHSEHDHILKRWTQTCSWSSIGNLKNVFCVDSNNVCFAGKIYLKPVQRSERVTVIGLFFKENDQDYLLMDDENIIVSAGYNFINSLGYKILNLPMQFICEDLELIDKWAKEGLKTNHHLDFYSTKCHSSVFNAYQESKKGFNQSQKNCHSQRLLEYKNELQKIGFVFSVSYFNFGRISFKCLKLSEVPQIIKKPTYKKSLIMTEEQTSQILIHADSINKDESKAILAFTPSISSSNQEQSSSTIGFLAKLQKLFYSKETIKDKKVVKIVCILGLLCLGGLFLGISKIIINEKGYKELEELIHADSASSDNLQLVMIIYSKALSVDIKLKALLQNTNTVASQNGSNQNSFMQSLQFQIKQLKFQQEYLHSLIIEQLLSFDDLRTSLTDSPLFQYENNLVMWSDTNGPEVQITTISFINNFMYFYDKIDKIANNILQQLFNLQTTAQSLSKMESDFDSSVRILKMNFQVLEKISKDNLQFYKTLETSTKRVIQLYTYIKISMTIVATISILVLLNAYLEYRCEQNSKISQVYKYISQNSVADMLCYYVKLKKALRKFTLFSKKQQEEMHFLQKQDNGVVVEVLNSVYQENYQNITSKPNEANKGLSIKLSVQKNKFTKTKILLICVLICVVGLNILIQTSQSTILNKSEQVFTLINDFINSQTQIFSTYLLKKSDANQDYQEAHHLLAMVEVELSQVIISSLKIFLDFDEEFQDKLTKLLTHSVCDLTRQNITEEHYQQCIQDWEMKIIKNGVINGFNYFTRQLQKYLSQEQQGLLVGNRWFYLQKIDKTLFQMFKCFQIIQETIVHSLKIKINNEKVQFIIYMCGELMVFFAFLIFIRKFYYSESRKSSDRVGRILLLPIRVIKTEPKILKNFELSIDYFSLQSE